MFKSFYPMLVIKANDKYVKNVCILYIFSFNTYNILLNNNTVIIQKQNCEKSIVNCYCI